MKNITTRLSILASVACITLASQLSALTITPTSGTLGTTRFEGNQTSQSEIDTIIGPIIAPATFVYKQDQGGGETGSLAGSYTTTFSNTSTDPQDATVVHNGGAFVQPTAWALVKDGNQTPAWYLFNLTALGWNGTETLEFQGFWPNQGAISHVALYGGGGTSVPDGGTTVALLGLAFGLVAAARRRFGV